MSHADLNSRIETNPKVMGGQPVLRGTRLTVKFVVNLLAHGASIDEIVDEYKGVTKEDVLACLAFAAESVGQVEPVGA